MVAVVILTEPEHVSYYSVVTPPSTPPTPPTPVLVRLVGPHAGDENRSCSPPPLTRSSTLKLDTF